MTRTLFTGGQVFDGVRHLGAAAVLVEDGRVAHLGDPGRLRADAGLGVEEVDLGGGLLMPGFLDAHMHPLTGGLQLTRCDLTGLAGPDEYLDAIARRHAEEAPAAGPDDWFRGGGWLVDAFGEQGPTARLLDRVVPDRPAFLASSDHHDAWVNSRALELAGVTAHTPDPSDGWFVRDADGRPTGTLREGAMTAVWERVTLGERQAREGLLAAQEYLWSQGITGWHDALVGGYAALDDPSQAYLDLLESGALRSRVRVSLWWDRHRGVEQVQELWAARRRLEAAGLAADSVKVMVDGITETFTAAVCEPYDRISGCPCGDRGLAFLDTGALREAVTALDAEGFSVHFHAIGDRAVRDALDAVAAARRANGMTATRHQAAHLQLVRPEDRPRFRALEVTANLEGTWAHARSPDVQALTEHVGPERAAWQYPFADIVAAGGHLAGGSDWPVNPPGPVAAVHVLVNRRSYSDEDDPGDALVPAQGVSVETALAAYTSGTARVNGWVDVGSVQVGSRADLVVLDRDPFGGPVERIGAAGVVRTYVAGECVFER